MKELYFSRRNNKSGKDSHFVLKSENNRWHASEVEAGVGLSLLMVKLCFIQTNIGSEPMMDGQS